MFRDFISLFFPRTCIQCNKPLISKEAYLCTGCKLDLPLTFDFKLPANDLFQKFASEPKISSAQAFISFYQHGIAQKLLHHLKYKGVQDLGKVLGRWFAPQLMELELDFIIPIPLHHKKQRKRGYNQSQLIAEGLSEQLEIPVKSTLVSREINTRSQTRKSKLQRWQDMENIYSRISADLGGKKILVVDDVVTTGATVSMLCARLVEAGASEIHVACIARGV